VKDIFPGASGSTSVYQGGTAGAFGTDKFVFTAVDSYTANGIANQQIWISDGSAAGTYALSASETGYLARALVVDSANNKIFFFAGTAAAGTELWTSDGTIAGTGMVDDFCPGTCVGAASGVDLKVTLGITLLGDGRVIFRGNDGSSGSEPVVSDGTASGTYLVDMVSGTAGSMPTLFLPIVSGVTLTKVLIFATDGTTGLEPWVIQP
jgi:ELWxxDGT repeat protein